MIRAQQYQVGQLRRAAVFPMPDVMGMQTPGRVTARNRAHGVAVLEYAAKPPADQAGRPTGANDLAVTFKPNFTCGITRQGSAFGVGEQRTQMQGGGALLNVDMHHHGRVLPVWTARRLGVPSSLAQTQKFLG